MFIRESERHSVCCLICSRFLMNIAKYIFILLFAVNSVCMGSTNPRPEYSKACAYTLLKGQRPAHKNNGYAEAAKKLGLRFLLLKMKPENYNTVALMAHSLKSNNVAIKATGSGVESEDGKDTNYPETRFNQSMIPLLQRDSGKWAHQLIGNGSDMISAGVRIKPISDWSIGLIVPVEVLDYYDFTITSTITPADRLSQIISGMGNVVFDSQKSDLENFKDVFAHQVSALHYPHSYDVFSYYQFHLEQPLPLSEVALIWIPAPILNEQLTDEWSSFPGQWQLRLPPRGQPVRVQLSIATGVNSWRYVAPHKEAFEKYLDVNEGLGTWFNIVPDWGAVADKISESASPPKFKLIKW